MLMFGEILIVILVVIMICGTEEKDKNGFCNPYLEEEEC